MNYNENNPRYFKNQTDSIKNRNPRGGSQKSIRPWILAAWLLGISVVGEPLRAERETLQKISLEQRSDSLKDFSADFQFKAGTICQGGTCGIRTDTGQYHRDETCPFCNSHLAKQGEDKSLKAGGVSAPAPVKPLPDVESVDAETDMGSEEPQSDLKKKPIGGVPSVGKKDDENFKALQAELKSKFKPKNDPSPPPSPGGSATSAPAISPHSSLAGGTNLASAPGESDHVSLAPTDSVYQSEQEGDRQGGNSSAADASGKTHDPINDVHTVEAGGETETHNAEKEKALLETLESSDGESDEEKYQSEPEDDDSFASNYDSVYSSDDGVANIHDFDEYDDDSVYFGDSSADEDDESFASDDDSVYFGDASADEDDESFASDNDSVYFGDSSADEDDESFDEYDPDVFSSMPPERLAQIIKSSMPPERLAQIIKTFRDKFPDHLLDKKDSDNDWDDTENTVSLDNVPPPSGGLADTQYADDEYSSDDAEWIDVEHYVPGEESGYGVATVGYYSGVTKGYGAGQANGSPYEKDETDDSESPDGYMSEDIHDIPDYSENFGSMFGDGPENNTKEDVSSVGDVAENTSTNDGDNDVQTD